MWSQQPKAEIDRRKKRFLKDHRDRELWVVLTNLDKYFNALIQGTKPKQIQGGSVHPEPMDVYAITEKGANEILGKNKARGLIPTRLYVYPDTATEVLHLITLGDKSTQKNDIEYCKQYVRSILDARSTPESGVTG